MATRSTEFPAASCSVQEAHDFSLIAQAATLGTRVPFLDLLRWLPYLC